MSNRHALLRLNCLDEQSRPRKSEQDDKWSFCLTAGTLCLRIRRDHEQTTTPEPHTGLQDPMGRWIATGTLAE